MALQGLIRFLLPKDDSWYDMLEALARLGHEASVALSAFKSKPAAEIRDTVQALEHQADGEVRKMEEALARTFVTPIDREDLHRLTGQLDDIVDLANLAARTFILYELPQPTAPMLSIMESLNTATACIAAAVPHLRRHEYDKLLEETHKVRAVEKEADVVYRDGIHQLFSIASIDARELLKQKEALDHLEQAVDHCDNVADLLANLAVKHG
jgi:uncharacterized protein